MSYLQAPLRFHARKLPAGDFVVVSEAGEFTVLKEDELEQLQHSPSSLPLITQAELQAKHFLRSSGSGNNGLARLLRSRKQAKQETATAGPSLHIIVPTLQCAHTCRYCQVSRSLDDSGFSMSRETLEKACTTVFQSAESALTIEFQGGDPLLRFDLVRFAVERIAKLAEDASRKVRIVVASTLHQLTPEMCAFFKAHQVYLSTSLDGPADVHNKNRPVPTRDSHQRTLAGIELARKQIGPDSVAALMTATAESLRYPEEIVDEYVRLGFDEIFLRPLSLYGFAKRNEALLGYGPQRFQAFYERAHARIQYWAERGVELREVYASIILNKLLSTFDAGYVDLQSPNASGSAVVVYNYDGYVYPSDEARMLTETGDTSLRMGRIGEPLSVLLQSEVRAKLVEAGNASTNSSCSRCAYQYYCAPNPVDAQAQFGRMAVNAAETHHCARHLNLFDYWLAKLQRATPSQLDRYHAWARCSGGRHV